MNAPAIFAFNAAAVRVFNIENAPWFMASDIAGILGYRDAPNMVRMLDDDEAATHQVSIRSENGVEQMREVSIISESVLYSATFKSKRQEAKAFRKWVTSEVLPSLRQHGTYTMPGAAESVPEYSNPLSLSHRADIAVAADRTFRAMMRSGRTVGLPLPQALRRANEITLQKTGVNMLRELGAEDAAIEKPEANPVERDFYGIARFFSEWSENSLPVPFTVCKSSDFYQAYLHWAKINGIEPSFLHRFFVKAKDHSHIAKKGMVNAGDKRFRVMTPAGSRAGVESGDWCNHASREISRFSESLRQWESEKIT